MFYKGSEDREKRLRFSIRKVSFGAASVAVATLYLFMGSGVVSAAEKDSGDRGVHQVEGPDSRSNSDKIEHSQGDSNQENLDHSDSTNVVKEKASGAEGIEGEATGAVTTSKDTNSVSDRVQDGRDSQEQSVSDTTPSNSLEDKPKKRSRRDLSTSSEQTDDPAANQVFEAPNENENVDGLLAKLVNLSNTINNETKLADIDKVAATKGIAPGEVKELNEFGGWKAVIDSDGQGKFAVARKTANGVFPIETVNTVKQNNYTNRTWTSESVLDRGNEHVLLLSEVRTQATRTQKVFDKTEYKDNYEGNTIARGLTGYNGIEKTFKAFSPTVGSTTKVSFKTGYTGDIDGSKAKYKVEVLGRTDETSTPVRLYSVTFDPSRKNTTPDMKVIAARDGNSSYIDTSRGNTSTDTLNTKLAERGKSPNGTTGTFTSKDIEIPPGYTEYTVRISSADNTRLGMGYQVPWKHYALPIAGLEFSITQDTKKAAKALLTKTYDKLKEQLDDDTKWSTPETKAVYEAKLQKIKDALNSDTSTTASYKTVAEDAVAQQKKLNEEVQIKKKANDAVTAKLTEKEQSIEDNGHLSPTEKSRAKEQAKEEARKANLAITGAGSQTAVTTAQATGEADVQKVNPVGKEKAKQAIQDELDAKLQAIDNNNKLSQGEKDAAKEDAKAKAKAQTDAIDKQPANAN
ncbi:YSIRK-type signal peptide-containing protein, partial [Streptococcus sp. 544]|uniref:YSIRK-type signal peptide-containing protein n=1 Tax=Streptococcus sp. 544 TaxID=2582640 RepID=UPI00156315D0